MLAGRTSDFDKLLAIRTYIYEAGRWNNFQPYSYDLNDPFGENIHNKLLSTFMDNRKGNCISMPLLFIALAERIDPDLQIRGVLAPRHLTCRFRDRQTDDVMLIEPTNGGFPARNQHYIDNYGITQKAIQSGLYLRDLTRRELISDIMHVLVKHANKELNNHNRALEYAGIQLMLFPDGLCGYFSWAASLEWECQTTGLFAKLKHREPLTMEEKELATRYRQQVQMLDSLAEAKGWKPESEEQRATYLKEIEAEKQKRKSSQKTTSRVTSTKR